MADAKQASLTVLGGPLAGSQISLPEDGVVTIGSAADCSFQLSTPSVGPLHARLFLERGHATVHAADAERPLHINDTPLSGESAALHNGDILWLGAPGEEDVVMLQCILAPQPEEAPAAESGPAAATPDVETQALWSSEGAEPPAPEAPETPPAAEAPSDDVTVAFDAGTIPTPDEDGVTEPAPPAAEAAGDDEPLIIAFDQPSEGPPAEAVPVDAPPAGEDEAVVVEEPGFVTGTEETPASVAEGDAPDEAYVIDADDVASEIPPTLVAGPDVAEMPEEPPTVAIEAEAVPEPPIPTVEPLVEAPAPTIVTPEEPPVAEVVSPPEPPPAPEAPPPAPPPPASPPPAPPPGSAPPSAPVPPAPRSPDASPPAEARARDASAPARSRSRPGSLRRGPKPPPRPAPPPEEAEEQFEDEAPSRSPVLLAVAGFAGVLVVAGLGFAVWRFVLAKPETTPAPAPVAAATAAPPPVAPPTAPPVAPTPEATAAAPAATPTPLPTATPTPVAAEPAQQPTPTPAPTATPAPTPTPTPPPAPAAAPPQPSAAELQAQQNAARVQQLLGQADTALAARQYDAAIGHLDEALRLEPGNSRATTTRAQAVALRDLARRRFVAGRTRVQGKAKGGGGLAGFDTGDADVREAPDIQGRIEFEMAPPSGISAGAAWTLQIFVVNEGRKPIEIEGATATTRVNGSGSGSPVTPRTRRISTQQRALVGELSGTWSDGTTSWSTLVTITANKGNTLRASVTWQ